MLFKESLPIDRLYFFWKCLCFATGPVSVILRAYLPALVQSITYSLGHDISQKDILAKCNSPQTCYLEIWNHEVHYTAFVHYLRSFSTIIEIITTFIITSFSDTIWRFHLYFSCVIILSISSIFFIFISLNQWNSLWGASCLYTIMMSVSASCDCIQSSYIPVFMRNQIDGKKASSVSMFLTNVGSITILLISLISSMFGANFQSIISMGGLISLFACMISSFYFCLGDTSKPIHLAFEDDFEEDKKRGNYWNFFRSLYKYPEALKLCMAWILFTCSMTNFMVNLNLIFKSSLSKSDSSTNIIFSLFILTSYFSATTSLLIVKHYNVSNSFKTWVNATYIVSIFIAAYGVLGSTNPYIGMNHTFEYWLSDIFYIASASSFRAIIRFIYGQMLPDGSDSKFYGMEIVGGLIGTWFTGLLSGLIQNKFGDGKPCFILSVILSMISFYLFKRCDIEAGKDRLINTL